jgi:hypothetical protein
LDHPSGSEGSLEAPLRERTTRPLSSSCHALKIHHVSVR